MYTQIFGNYLLNTGIVTQEQLLTALEAQASARASLGALAIHKGYMTASEAERIFILQTHQDKRFGELAVEEGYLTTEQVEELLNCQVPGFILLGQILTEQGVLTASQLQNIVTDYRSEYEIYDLDDNEEQNEIITHLLADIDTSETDLNKTYITDYLILLFNNLIRFIGNDFMPLNIMKIPEVPTAYCTSQDLGCHVFHICSALDMDSDAAIAFASRYAHEEFTEFDEYVRASMEDFLNLHNGLFVVNISNNYSLEATLEPPMAHDNSLYTTGKTTYLFPILFPFGTIHFICSIYPTPSEEESEETSEES